MSSVRITVVGSLGFLSLMVGASVAQDSSRPVLIERYADWTLQCFQASPPRCEAFQKRKQGNTELVLWVELSQKRGAAPDLNVVTPLGTRLADGLSLSIDRKFSIQGKYKTCLDLGCLTHIPGNAVLIDRLMKGTLLLSTVTAANGQKITMTLPLTGLAQSYQRLGQLLKGR